MARTWRGVLPLAGALTFSSSALHAADIPATPSDFRSKLGALTAGDTLKLAAGDYTGGMTFDGKHGAPGAPITVEGPTGGMPARFLGSASRNSVDIRNSSYITLKNLVFDGQDLVAVDAVKAGGGASDFAHHITVEGCTIVRHDGGRSSQQTVGISTKIVAWDWVVRGNVIDGAGTGMYFGNSDGTRAFIGGIVENNLFRSTLGYNMQVKHQLARENVTGVPTEDRVTIVRHNVFIKKSELPSPDGARPNLLVGGFPGSGPGANDRYEIYGNLFVHNDDDALLQATGRVHVHDNVFVDALHPAVRFVNHENKTVIEAFVYNNTIYDTATGISFSNTPTGASLVAANAVFSPNPLSGTMPTQRENVTLDVASAASHVVRPSKLLGEMDFFPIAGSPLHGAVVDVSAASMDVEHDRDFNGRPKDFSYRGAYQGEGKNPGWPLGDGLKPPGGSSGAGGTAGSGGGPATGGSAGAPATGGTSGATGAAGAVASGGASGTGGPGGAAGSSAATPNAASEDDGGCACRSVSRGRGLGPERGQRSPDPWGSAAVLLIALGGWRRALARCGQRAARG